MLSPDAFWADFCRRHEDGWCKTLSELIRFQTVSGDTSPQGEALWRQRTGQAFAYLNDSARRLGLITRSYQNRVLVIEIPGPTKAPVLGFPIHMDVVPAGTGWTRSPFGGDIAVNAIWGRGAQDDKGPIVQVLYALLAAVEMSREYGKQIRKTVRMIVVSEEECGQWDDIPYYFEREAPPDFCIVPDANFPITNGEKGMINLEIAFRWDDEPLPGEFELIAGERPNVVPSEAKMIIGPELLERAKDVDHLCGSVRGAPRTPDPVRREDGVWEILFHGINAHGSQPLLGYNAVGDALKMMDRLPVMQGNPAGRILGWLSSGSHSLDGDFFGIKAIHDKVGATTVNMGVVRADRTSARCVLNIRHPIGLTVPEVEARIRERVEKIAKFTEGLTEVKVEVERGAREPIYVDPAQFSEWIEPMRRAYTTVTKRETRFQTIGGTTFAKAFPNAVCFGPTDPAEDKELAHQADEHVTLAAMRRNVTIYGRTITGIVFGDI